MRRQEPSPAGIPTTTPDQHLLSTLMNSTFGNAAGTSLSSPAAALRQAPPPQTQSPAAPLAYNNSSFQQTAPLHNRSLSASHPHSPNEAARRHSPTRADQSNAAQAFFARRGGNGSDGGVNGSGNAHPVSASPGMSAMTLLQNIEQYQQQRQISASQTRQHRGVSEPGPGPPHRLSQAHAAVAAANSAAAAAAAHSRGAAPPPAFRQGMSPPSMHRGHRHPATIGSSHTQQPMLSRARSQSQTTPPHSFSHSMRPQLRGGLSDDSKTPAADHSRSRSRSQHSSANHSPSQSMSSAMSALLQRLAAQTSPAAPGQPVAPSTPPMSVFQVEMIQRPFGLKFLPGQACGQCAVGIPCHFSSLFVDPHNQHRFSHTRTLIVIEQPTSRMAEFVQEGDVLFSVDMQPLPMVEGDLEQRAIRDLLYRTPLPMNFRFIRGMYTKAEIARIRTPHQPPPPTNNLQQMHQRMPQSALNASFRTSSLPMHSYHQARGGGGGSGGGGANNHRMVQPNPLSPAQVSPLLSHSQSLPQPHPMSMAASPSRRGGSGGNFFSASQHVAAAAAAAAASSFAGGGGSPARVGANGLPERSASALAGGGGTPSNELYEQKRSRSESFTGLPASSPTSLGSLQRPPSRVHPLAAAGSSSSSAALMASLMAPSTSTDAAAASNVFPTHSSQVPPAIAEIFSALNAVFESRSTNLDDPAKAQELISTLEQVQRSLGPQKFSEMTGGKSPRAFVLEAAERRRNGASPPRLAAGVLAAAAARVQGRGRSAMETGGDLPADSFAAHSMAMAGASTSSNSQQRSATADADRVRSPFDERNLSTSFKRLSVCAPSPVREQIKRGQLLTQDSLPSLSMPEELTRTATPSVTGSGVCSLSGSQQPSRAPSRQRSRAVSVDPESRQQSAVGGDGASTKDDLKDFMIDPALAPASAPQRVTRSASRRKRERSIGGDKMLPSDLMLKSSRDGDDYTPSPVRLSDFASRNAEALSGRPRKISQNSNTSRKPSIPAIAQGGDSQASSHSQSNSHTEKSSSSQERQDLYLSPQTQGNQTATSTSVADSKSPSDASPLGNEFFADLNDNLRHSPFPSLDITAFEGRRRSSHRMSITASPLASRRNTKDEFPLLNFDSVLPLSSPLVGGGEDGGTRHAHVGGSSASNAMDTASPSQTRRRRAEVSSSALAHVDSRLKHRRSSSATLFNRRKSSVLSLLGSGVTPAGVDGSLNFDFNDHDESKELHNGTTGSGSDVSSALKSTSRGGLKSPRLMYDSNVNGVGVGDGRGGAFWKSFPRERNVVEERLGMLSPATRKHSNSMPGNFMSTMSSASSSWMSPEYASSSQSLPLRWSSPSVDSPRSGGGGQFKLSPMLAVSPRAAPQAASSSLHEGGARVGATART